MLEIVFSLLSKPVLFCLPTRLSLSLPTRHYKLKKSPPPTLHLKGAFNSVLAGIFSAGLLSSAALASDPSSTSIAENTQITFVLDYKYTSKHGLPLENLSRGPIRIGNIVEARENNQPNELINSDTGQKFYTTQTISGSIQNGIQQAFISGSAQLVDSGENLLLSGKLTSIEFNNEKLILRAELNLTNKGKSVWTSTLFSKVNIPPDAIVGATIGTSHVKIILTAAIDKLINELFFDDYFLLEILD